jgi:hypothetical protein
MHAHQHNLRQQQQGNNICTHVLGQSGSWTHQQERGAACADCGLCS